MLSDLNETFTAAVSSSSAAEPIRLEFDTVDLEESWDWVKVMMANGSGGGAAVAALGGWWVV